jgi:hypothetical protein
LNGDRVTDMPVDYVWSQHIYISWQLQVWLCWKTLRLCKTIFTLNGALNFLWLLVYDYCCSRYFEWGIKSKVFIVSSSKKHRHVAIHWYPSLCFLSDKFLCMWQCVEIPYVCHVSRAHQTFVAFTFLTHCNTNMVLCEC